MSKSLTSYMSNQADLPMRSKAPLFLSVLLSACLVPALAVAESKAPPAGLSATQIVDKHVAARGGLQAWRGVQTLSGAASSMPGAATPRRAARNWPGKGWVRA